MITQLASPSVCVIDDEPEDYEPILTALNSLYVSTVHLVGDIDKLPPQPFPRLELIFIDLHLSGTVGKAAASFTANVFTKVVSAESAPIVVVIWSKYAQDKVDDNDVPPEDQETEAELFKRTLLEADPRFEGRLIFVEMGKPKVDDRPEDWAKELQAQIDKALEGQSAVELLWAWGSLVKDRCAAVNSGLTSVAAQLEGSNLTEKLKSVLQRLARAQGENDLSAETAPRHCLTILAGLLTDQVEHADTSTLTKHGTWLTAKPGKVSSGFAARMNGILLTSDAATGGSPFAPGTIYRLANLESFQSTFGKDFASLVELLCVDGPASQKRVEWRDAVRPVVLELSPSCDAAQNHRVTSFLVAGVIVPASRKSQIKKGDAFVRVPAFQLRWPAADFAAQDAVLAFCHRYKATWPSATVPNWLVPWFRLRELPTTSLRNSQASNSSRVGFVSLADQ